ncbi:unnamed protein product [Lampetra planeri]
MTEAVASLRRLGRSLERPRRRPGAGDCSGVTPHSRGSVAVERAVALQQQEAVPSGEASRREGVAGGGWGMPPRPCTPQCTRALHHEEGPSRLQFVDSCCLRLLHGIHTRPPPRAS